MAKFFNFFKGMALEIMKNTEGSDVLNMRPPKGSLHYRGGYTPMRNRSKEAQEVARKREEAWLNARNMAWPTFSIHGVEIKAPDRKTAIKKYNAMHR